MPSMISRRNAVLGTVAMAMSAPGSGSMAEKVADDGMHVEPWFHQSFLDLREDLAEAEAAGKGLAVFFEQRGCPYCVELHRTSLADPETAEYIRTHFVSIQLNLYGSREVTDFDGKKLEERRLAERWRINFTPTIVFLPPTVAATSGKTGREAEVWRLQGYWKAFHLLATFAYVKTGGYKTEPNFQKWLQDYVEKLRAEGKVIKVW